jgi:hypothetical protein
MPRAKPRKKKDIEIEALILPKQSETLSGLWRAFKQAGTWYRVGRSHTRRLRFRHTAYKGTLRLERLSKAIRCVVKDEDGSGMIVGAFLGHTTRHAAAVIDSVNIRFS